MSPLAVSGAYSRANALSRQQYLHPALLGATRQQYYQPLPVLAEVDPIARAKINPVPINAGTTPFTLEKLP
jgi:hypothetical protein